ncbi:hypothetical protein ADK49_24460 [Streptomyces sp. WM6349]|nr:MULTISPECIES: hypothetical protein [unclassified Streptomyces]KOU14161.1 hypothetical protein ADK49_24460 [Streptomyces sp. WM6349]KOV40793.1 hypothetical protein ADK98_28975 [Streptomyces sp. H036]
MAGEQDGASGGGRLVQQREERFLDQRVEPLGRFVENHHLWIVLHRLHQPELLLHAPRVAPDGAREDRGRQPQPIAQLAAAGHRSPLQRGQQIERFGSGEFRVQAQLAREVPQMRGHPPVIGVRVQPEHPHTPLAGAEQAGQAPQRRRLPRTVRAEEAEHLT